MTEVNNVPFYILITLLTCTATLLCGTIIIPSLKKYAEQPIYEGGPSWHVSKTGTPTMGGITFLISITVALLGCAIFQYALGKTKESVSLFICLAFSVINSVVGIIDDLTKLRHKRNAGLSVKAKLILQFLSAALFLFARFYFLGDDTVVTSRFGKFDLKIAYYLIAAVILVGITNCANLTDGIDGLATSVAFAIGISSFYLGFGRNDNVCFISTALIGATVGFLAFNIHPAKVFMGDTGSLFLGALISSLAFELDNPIIAISSGFVFVIEGISVIAQVAVYKISKKRLFKMAPLHHHLEKSGWDENKICIFAIIMTLLFSTVAIMIR